MFLFLNFLRIGPKILSQVLSILSRMTDFAYSIAEIYILQVLYKYNKKSGIELLRVYYIRLCYLLICYETSNKLIREE